MPAVPSQLQPSSTMTSSKSQFLSLRNPIKLLKTWGSSPRRPHGTETVITCRQTPAKAGSATLSSADRATRPLRIPRRKPPTTRPKGKRIDMSSMTSTPSVHASRCVPHPTIPAQQSFASLNDSPSSTASHRDYCLAPSASRLPRSSNEATLEECLDLRAGSDDPSPSSLHDMLCKAKATVVTVPSREDEWSCDRDNDVLREYFRIRTNVVLDSPCPSMFPHIVLSPAQEGMEDFYTPLNNRVSMYQEASWLCVPRYNMTRWSHMPGQSPESYWPNTMRSSIDCGEPSRCFSQSKFNHQCFEARRSSMSEQTCDKMQSELVKAVAIEASSLALDLQQRYDTLDAFASIEKPFVWSDPAEPILRMAACPGLTLLESYNPFAVPHIMISTPPQQDPWIPYSNALNDPQDAGFGQYLVVPSRMVDFINFEGSPFNDDDEEFDSFLESSDADSPPDTPEPETPTDLEEGDYFPSTDWQYSDDSDEDDDHHATAKWNSPIDKLDIAPSIVAPLPPRPSKPIFYMDDEDEDDLPPLDDWYLSVAARNGLKIATAS
ncbi:hypothetical protein BKA70DRAFT_566437 [Coprinopsis sp. MPI-PUGE-AT-0042]|nr:hypothetical protein BKA70DRAFT_566437 [Coprinopsis sp. MPI-PUGE-AT-0042]